jgi:hypothetical protein
MSNSHTIRKLGSFDNQGVYGELATPLLNKPVKITSGEQFVPIFLARSLKTVHEPSSYFYGFDMPRSVFNPVHDEPTIELKSKVLVNNIKNWLYEDIDEYTIPVSTSKLSSSSVKDGFKGTTAYSVHTDYGVSLLGFFGYVGEFRQRYIKSKYYQDLFNTSVLIVRYVLPQAIVVVKAKHLNQLRLGLFLGEWDKVTIPYSDIKFLKTVNNPPSSSLLRDMLSPTGIVFKTEYCSQDTLNNLVGLESGYDTISTVTKAELRERLEKMRQIHPIQPILTAIATT